MRFVVTLFSLLLLGCQNPLGPSTVSVGVQFAVYNSSPDPVQMAMRGRDVGPIIPPNMPTRFRVGVDVPKAEYDAGYQTSRRVVQVSVAFRNLRTGEMFTQPFCSAAANDITDVFYTVTTDLYGQTYVSIQCS